MDRNTTTEDFAALKVRAESAVSGSDWAAAAAAYEQLVSSRPQDVDLKCELARAYEELGRLQDAVAVLTDPAIAGRGKPKQRLAKMYITAKDFSAATPLVNELVAASPEIEKFRKWQAICEAGLSRDPRIDQKLDEGQALISAGRLEEAEEFHLKLLTEFPDLSRAYLRLGLIYAQQKRWADVIKKLRAGLAIEPGNKKIRTHLARALFKEGHAAEAAAHLEAGRQKDVDTLFLLQRCYMKQANWVKVDELGEHLLAIAPPNHPILESASELRQDAQVEMASARTHWIARSGGTDQALLGYRDIASRYPDAPLAWMNLGVALAGSGLDDEAIQAFGTALRLRPGDINIREALTSAVVRSREEDEVLRYVQDAIASGSADFECHRWLSQYHNKQFEWAACLESARNALAIKPKHPSARMLVARALMRLSRLAEALDELNVMLAMGAKPVVPLQLKGDIFVRLARIEDAIALYREALEHAPDHPLISYRLSYAYLLKGDIPGFHSLHEKRRNVKTFIENNKDYPYLNWNGELPIEGKLLVWSEFGLGVGQNILHMTFLKPLVELGLDVVFEVEPRLVDLCRRSFPDLTVVPNDGELPAGITHHTPIGSLSRWFKPDLASFETIRPFFLPDAEAVAAHRARLQGAAGQGQLLVGISWTSNNPFVGDVKSVPLDQLLDALSVPGVTLVNLQYGDHSQSIAEAEAKTGKRLMDSGIDNSDDLDGLAAVVGAMDLVVCIGHTTAHMAGAIGTPNFVLLPAAPFGHWLAAGEGCIWYPASKLFRQAPIDDDWSAVLDRARSAVSEFESRYDAASWLATTLLPGLKPSSGRAEEMSSRALRDAIWSFFAQGAYRSALGLIDRLAPDELSRDLSVLRGDMLALIGRGKQARSVFRDLKTDGGAEDREIDRKILSINLGMYDLEASLPLARSLAEEEPAYRLTAASILYHLRRYEEALTELRALSVASPQAEGLSRLLGNVLLETGAVARAEAYLADQAAMTGSPGDYALLGRSLSVQGRDEAALAALDKGVALARYHPAANFWRTQSRIRLGLVERTPLPPLLGEVPEVTTEDVVIFFAADSRFFWEHGLVLIGSAAQSSPAAKCHVHVINPDPGIAPAIEIVRKLLPEFGLSYSYEHVDFDGCSDVHIRTYYASVRFVRLAQIFARAAANYLCIDADGIVRGDVTAAIAAPQASRELADAGIYLRFDDRPHIAVLASASLWRPTPAAAQFLDEVATLVGSTLEAREAIWFLDQIVLNHVLRERGGKDVAVDPLDITYLDWFFHDESLIWTGKGKRKSDDNRYKGEVSKFRYLQSHEDIMALMPQGSGDADRDDQS